MGVCLSCLGLGGRESHDSESSRLLYDDLYPGGYGYGSLNQGQQTQGDPEYSRREREALDAICQRASDSVIDIWALQPQPHLQPRTTLRSNGSASISVSSSRVPSNELPAAAAPPTTTTTDHPHPDLSSAAVQHEPKRPPSATAVTDTPNQNKLAAAPKHWGEVVITNKKGKKSSRALGIDDNGNDLFGVLRVP